MTEEELAVIERDCQRAHEQRGNPPDWVAALGLTYTPLLLAEVRDLREVARAIEQRIAIGLDDLAMPADKRPPTDLHPADKISEYLVPWAYHEIERLQAALNVLAERQAEIITERDAMRAALGTTEAHLALLRHRADSSIRWGTPGLPDRWEVDRVIGQARKALGY